jgi:hypothetical protein
MSMVKFWFPNARFFMVSTFSGFPVPREFPGFHVSGFPVPREFRVFKFLVSTPSGNQKDLETTKN